jgi:hypothetical protein
MWQTSSGLTTIACGAAKIGLRLQLRSCRFRWTGPQRLHGHRRPRTNGHQTLNTVGRPGLFRTVEADPMTSLWPPLCCLRTARRLPRGWRRRCCWGAGAGRARPPCPWGAARRDRSQARGLAAYVGLAGIVQTLSRVMRESCQSRIFRTTVIGRLLRFPAQAQWSAVPSARPPGPRFRAQPDPSRSSAPLGS